eukprot:scaffold278232_cov31-Tisochrysis_lutea.AAC.1
MAVEGEKRRVVVYLIRHGQSRWNEAQKRRDYIGLIRRIDHQLTHIGVKQARALYTQFAEGAKVGEGSPSSERVGLDMLLDVDAIWSSPLSRALQTALLGMHPVLLRDSGPPLVLKPALREKKNLGGLDTIGARRGHGCVDRALRSFGPAITPEELHAMRNIKVDHAEAERRWWNNGMETGQDVRKRIRRLLSEIAESSHGSIVLVGHSHYFRELFRMCLNTECVDQETINLLNQKKIGNCDVARCELDFSLHSERVISRVHIFTPAAAIKRTMRPARRILRGAKIVPEHNVHSDDSGGSICEDNSSKAEKLAM